MSPYYKYKKERLESKFKIAQDTLTLMQGAITEYTNTESIYIRRAILGYFQDFTEYVIDMCETYLVITESYIDGVSGIELVKRARIHGFLDDTLCGFLTTIVRLRNRYTHDYYKREGVEEDILTCCFSEIMYLQIFLEITESEIHLVKRSMKK
ncbi:MAG: hypothetical protein RR636_11635 [Clostridium sp.]|uniref:hypothetical protein n=1 Tax=Clostridium sp. TaxID=1506 RepID=UPI003067098B